MTILLKEITKENFFDVIRLKTENKSFSVFEEFVASNLFSLAQAKVEEEWVTKALYVKDELIGFVMYGYNVETHHYELYRLMIDHRFQDKGYGGEAVSLIMEEMIRQFECLSIYLTVSAENKRAIHLYEKKGFVQVGEQSTKKGIERIYRFSVS